MPELPDVELYLHCLRPRVVGQQLQRITVTSPFVLRSVDPPIDEAEGRAVREVQRIGKRVVLGLEGDLFIVIHLMIAGRFRWHDAPADRRSRGGSTVLASLEFATGVLLMTEAGSRKRASLHLVRGAAGLAAHDRGGLEVLDSGLETFAERLRRENHTLKRSLTDPRLISGIGNAYSDEILHRARLSPLTLTSRLTDEQIERLHDAVCATLREWTDRLRDGIGDRFPSAGEVTAFRPEMAVHGRYGKPCPVCAAPVQRIVYASNETNYCAACQTGGRVLADRSLSRLLRDDWPRTMEELETDRPAC